MGRVIAFAAAIAVAAALAASAGAGAPSSVIVFSARLHGIGADQLFAVSPSGTGLKQLTTGGAPAVAPAFSPAGTRIAFVRFGYGIYTMSRGGGGLHRVTTNGRDSYPTWSPNGKTIAFIRPLGTKWRVFTVPSSGGRPTELKRSPAAGRPTWTKAGLLVPTAADLLRVDAASGRVLKYYDATLDAIWGLNSVTLSPAISLLTYVGSRDPEPGDTECGEGPCQRFGLYLESLTAKRKKPKLIVKDAGPAVFSPDGKRIAFVGGAGLVVRPVASSTTTTVVPIGDITPTTAAPPTWR